MIYKEKVLDFIKKIFRQSTFLKIYGIYTNLRSVGPPPPPPSMGPKLGDRFIFNTPIAIVGIWLPRGRRLAACRRASMQQQQGRQTSAGALANNPITIVGIRQQ